MSKNEKPRDGPVPPLASSGPEDVHKASQDGVFLGWQRSESESMFPIYNIVKVGHPSLHSTVTGETLHTLHLKIPRTPSPYSGVAPSPWHNLGTELVNPATAREALETAGLNYTVVKVPLEEVVRPHHRGDVSHRWATVRTDTGDVLGIVGDNYVPIQNSDAFTFFDHLVGEGEAIFETAGALGRGERIWILAKLPGFIKVHGKDIVNKCLLLTNSHDGSSLVRIKLTPIRVVCNNTLTAALRGAGDVHFRHTSHAAEDMEQALSLLGLSNVLFQQLDDIFNRMALTKISEKQLLDYVKALVPDNGQDEDNVKSQEIRKVFLELYKSGQGADLSRGTLWGAFNCITEYADHKMEDDPNARLESIWGGRGEQLKLKAYNLAEGLM